ncbi:lytic transglycosylase domain-containing protein [Aestuariispira insulae]|nr:lytic transglycosylase domain-containing protein [Aestuariispira insulae]
MAATIVAACFAFAAPNVAAQETAALPPAGSVAEQQPEFNLPRLLTEKDVSLYRQIFEIQESGNWRKADRLIRELGDDILMGHVLFQRYMHPTHYRSKYLELKDWMEAYADHPGAPRIYDLAIKRRPKNYKYPVRPKDVDLSDLADDVSPDEPVSRPKKAKPQRPYRSKADRKKIRSYQSRVRRLVQRGSVTIAYEKLQQKPVVKLFDKVSYAESLGIVVRGYYRYNLDDKALDVADRAYRLAPETAENALWWGGLAAFRSEQYDLAARYFTKLGESKYVDTQTRTAAHYWASRAYLVGGQPHLVNPSLAQAAKEPRTFYGLLANRALGQDPGFDWMPPVLSPLESQLVLRVPAVRRSLALIQIGQARRAETELRRFVGNLPESLSRSMLAFADAAGLADVAYRIGAHLERRDQVQLDSAIYPLPGWEPQDGFSLDKALIYAFVRQESRFRPRAKSHVGARGLMQLMPATAGFVAGKRFSGKTREELYDPAYNLSLGQKYISHLLESYTDGGNLFMLTAAYNGGPGNLQKWMSKVDYKDDPLLFIESLPSRETRLFVEHVLSNLWIYRNRMGQQSPSLDAIVSGQWPVYVAQDGKQRLARVSN